VCILVSVDRNDSTLSVLLHAVFSVLPKMRFSEKQNKPKATRKIIA
jgi:hypothetical protein